jgi:hypothetical protein
MILRGSNDDQVSGAFVGVPVQTLRPFAHL